MLKLSGEEVVQGRFPDGTLAIKQDIYNNSAKSMCIQWNYESDSELFTLICLVKHIREWKGNNFKIVLDMPYVPNARMDRAEKYCDVSTLKYFCEVINSLNFEHVYTVDVHSSVTSQLLDRASNAHPLFFIEQVRASVTKLEGTTPTFFYPDEGCMKRISKELKEPFTFGIKMRDWETSKIKSLEVIGDVNIYKPVLICDDICSKGGTFLHSAKKLKELGVQNIYLYVTHCENTILTGELINSGLLKGIYTTDSIFTEEHELISVLEIPKYDYSICYK